MKSIQERRENPLRSLGGSTSSTDSVSSPAHTQTCWVLFMQNLFILKSSIIAEIPLLFKLIYFLMVYLHSGICILFHSKCYDSTCPILDKTPKLRKKKQLKERIRHFSPTHPHFAALNPASRRGREKLRSCLLSPRVLAFSFNLLPLSKPLPLQFNKSNFQG